VVWITCSNDPTFEAFWCVWRLANPERRERVQNLLFQGGLDSVVLKDTVGELYFCNLRCFCVLSVQLATRPNLSAEDKNGAYSLTSPSGEEHQFAGIVDVTRWATANAFR
jgi:hypothetical protein